MGKRGSVRIFRKPRSPYWWHDFYVDRCRHYASTDCTEKRTAQAVADARYRDAVLAAREKRKKRERDGADPTELTIDEAFSQWWTEHGVNLAEEDLGPYVTLPQVEDDPALAERPLNWLAAQVGRDKKLIHITTSDVLTVIGKRREKLAFDGHDDDGQPVYRVVSDRTVNRTVGKLLRRIMNWAAEALDADIPGPKKLKWSKVIFEEKLGLERKPLSVDDEAKLEEVARPELAAIQRFAFATSLRIAEIVSLTWPQVDFENREIRLIQKGERYRTIPMTAEIEAILLPLQGQHKMHVFTFVARRTRKDRWGNKFVKGERYPVTYWGIKTARQRDYPKAGFGMVGYHDLRRTALKRMDKAVGEEAAQKMAGHSSIKATRIYLRKDTDVEKLRTQMEARDAYVAGLREKAGVTGAAGGPKAKARRRAKGKPGT
jgi:integrase